ncbi:MAG: PhoD-like phosphatase N-terminal domain-containing protein [Planctomycetota bacterium]|jgi:alkaline phosphatase D
MSFERIAMTVAAMTVLLTAFGRGHAQAEGPYQATGIKIGEVTDSAAIVWTRLTKRPQRVGPEAPMPRVSYRDPATGKLSARRGSGRPDRQPVVEFPDGSTIETIEGAVPGAPGKVKVHYKLEGASDWTATGWRSVDPKRDYTRQFRLTGLRPNAKYQVRVEAGTGSGAVVEGGFKTAPGADESERVVFTVSTGQAYPDQDAAGGGYKIHAAMLKLDPSFFVHTGDIVYYDRLAKTLPLARWHWARMYSLPTNVEFHRQVASYFIKDDHDTWMNDCLLAHKKDEFHGRFHF